MPRKGHKRRKPRIVMRSAPGAAPGVVRVHPQALPTHVQAMAYSPASFQETVINNLDEIAELRRSHEVVWINVDGLGDAAAINKLGKMFGLHSLALEDVVNVHQRAKVEPYEESLFVVARMAGQETQNHTEQISIFLGDNFVITFQERSGDCLEPVRQRIRKSGSRIRKKKADFLLHALLDAIIDSYFPLTEKFADELDELEDQIDDPGLQNVAARLHGIRHDLLVFRRSLRPHRDAVNQLLRDETHLLSDDTRLFLRDCYDHTVQLIDLLEVYREICADLREYYLSMIGNRTNEVMRLLTIIATIFMPLSFIAGLYGMNFNTHLAGNMPELQFPYAYVIVLGVMGMVAGGMLLFFRRQGWIGRRRGSPGKIWGNGRK